MRTLAQLRNVRVSDMTPEEVRAVFRNAGTRLKREIEGNAAKIETVLNGRCVVCGCLAASHVNGQCPVSPSTVEG